MKHLTQEMARDIATRAISGIVRQFPHSGGRVLASNDDLVPPKIATPCFYGCYDWHSSVHSHWALARLVRLFPAEIWADEARRALHSSLTPDHILQELRYRQSNARFELPYGVAWLLTLQREFCEWPNAEWSPEFSALCALAEEQLLGRFESLPAPIRSGEHSQSAFAMGLAHDAFRARGALQSLQRVESVAIGLYKNDENAPLSYEPSAHDFLSPVLAEADLMARCLEPNEFLSWFERFWRQGSLTPVATADRSDGKLTHWDGLNLSRAWMFRRIANQLPNTHSRARSLQRSAALHLERGLEGLRSSHYAGSHWLGSFALYALSEVSWPVPQ